MKTRLYLLFTVLSLTSIAQNDLTSNLVICMPLDGNTTDYSGNNNNGINNGATLTADRFGNLNSAYHFNGSNNYISVSNSSSVSNIETNDELTISAWCNVYGWYQNWNVFSIVNKYNSSNDGGWDFTIQNPSTNNSGTGILFYASNLQSNVYLFNGPVNTQFNQWNFYAMTYSKNNNICKLYKNGNLLNSISTNSLELANTDSALFIGFSPMGPNEYSNGDIDELRVYNRALTGSEILDIYNGVSPCHPQVGIREYELKKTIGMIYPNPSNKSIQFKLNDDIFSDIDNVVSFKIYSIDGKELKNEKLNKADLGNHPINIESLSEGIYILNIQSGGYTQNLKFVKE